MFVFCRTLIGRLSEELRDGYGNAIICGVPGACAEAEAADGVLGAVFLIEHDVQKNIRVRLEGFGKGDRELIRFAELIGNSPAGSGSAAGSFAINGILGGPPFLFVGSGRLREGDRFAGEFAFGVGVDADVVEDKIPMLGPPGSFGTK